MPEKPWKEQKWTKNEPTFIQILEWLIEGAHISKNLIHHVSNTAAISHNVGDHNFRATLYFVYAGKFFDRFNVLTKRLPGLLLRSVKQLVVLKVG